MKELIFFYKKSVSDLHISGKIKAKLDETRIPKNVRQMAPFLSARGPFQRKNVQQVAAFSTGHLQQRQPGMLVLAKGRPPLRVHADDGVR